MPTLKDFEVPESKDFGDVQQEYDEIIEIIDNIWDELKLDPKPDIDEMKAKLSAELFTEKLSDWKQYRKKALEIMEIEGDWSVEV